jgi:hypothetical protein
VVAVVANANGGDIPMGANLLIADAGVFGTGRKSSQTESPPRRTQRSSLSGGKRAVVRIQEYVKLAAANGGNVTQRESSACL